MFTHTDLLTSAAKQHVDELIEEASRHRLAASLRRGRRQLFPESHAPAEAAVPPTINGPEVVGPASRLAPCESHLESQRSGAPAATASVR
jgi:hypothetical protein